MNVREDGLLNENCLYTMCHFTTIFTTCVALGGQIWLKFDGDICVLYLTLPQFFWFGYVPGGIDDADYDCLSPTLVILMRAIILLCFLTIINSILGFWIDIIESKYPVCVRLGRGLIIKMWSNCLVLLILILGLCLYVGAQSKRLINEKSDFDVSIGPGFELMVYLWNFQLLSTVVRYFRYIILLDQEYDQNYSDVLILRSILTP